MKKAVYVIGLILFLIASSYEYESEVKEDQTVEDLSELRQREIAADSLNLQGDDWIRYVNAE